VPAGVRMQLSIIRDRIRAADPTTRIGMLTRIMPGWLEADGPNATTGSLCEIRCESGSAIAEVVRVDGSGVALMPLAACHEVGLGALVRALPRGGDLPIGDKFLGRIVDGMGRPLDGRGSIVPAGYRSRSAEPPTIAERLSPTEPAWTGLRVIDGLMPLGRGQRIGIFAASGVGKTSLIHQLARQMDADAVVLALIGERGREVDAFHSSLGEKIRARTATVASTSDQPAALRVRALHQALALARHWQEGGRHVLLIIDSISRVAMALREIGLAAGEPPTIRAYPPSVFSVLPQIVEHCGALRSGGAITAVMTVLSEADDADDPICEIMKSLLDGHILLSREIAARGQFPAVDPLGSISRCAETVATSEQRQCARAALALLARFESARLLVESGFYTQGNDPEIDLAVVKLPELRRFMAQPPDQVSRPEDTIKTLQRIMERAR
jgi:flagellum-specific ATP synthase